MQLTNHADTAQAPVAWAARLVQRLRALYGTKFDAQWGNVSPADLAASWAEEIAGYSGEELRRGLEACKGRPFPPTLPEFLSLCRPALSPEAAYHEAVAGMAARARGEMGTWTHPAIYWAAVRVTSHDLLNQGYQALRGRWEHALRDVMAKGRWEPVPAPHLQLAAPGKDIATRAEALRFLQQVKDRLGVDLGIAPRDPKAWADRILQKAKNGRGVSPAVHQMALRAVTQPQDQS